MHIKPLFKIGFQNWPLLIDFVMRTMREFSIAEDKVRVGLVGYSTEAKVEWYLNDFFNINDLLYQVSDKLIYDLRVRLEIIQHF